MHPLLKTPKSQHLYKEGASFSKVMMLYRFDKKLRMLLLNEVEKIEISPNNDMLGKMKTLFSDYPEIDLAALGFPTGWENEPLWQ